MPIYPPLRVVQEVVDSQVLAGNRFGDPTARMTPVILPPSYDLDQGRRYPVLYVLSPFTATGWQQLNSTPLAESLDERLSRLYATVPQMTEVLVVLPDCFTVLGGSQYVNSPVLGRYEDHLVMEVVPQIDRHFRTKSDPAHRGVLGRSSGGIGALWMAMNHPDVFGALGSHAGDGYFRLTLMPELLKYCRRVRKYGGPLPLLTKLLQIGKGQRTSDLFDLMSILASAAAYSPEPEAGPSELPFRMPIDWETGALSAEIFDRWLRFDPVEICTEARYHKALASQRLIFLDGGTRDEYYLDLAARQLTKRLREAGLGERLVFEEFDDGHMNTNYRYDRSLPLLAGAIG